MSGKYYRKMLFIGLGGSGGKTLRFLKRDLLEWLDSVGWVDQQGNARGIPRGIHFLHIDTPTSADGLDVGGSVLSGQEYQGLVAPGMTMDSLMSALDKSDARGESLTGWRVDRSRIKVKLTDGAGQMRAIGRSVSKVYAGQIKDGLDKVILAMQSGDTGGDESSDIDALYRHVHGEDPQTSSSSEAPVTVFVSSLAGGTGAGLMFEVADIYRLLKPDWADNSVGIWFTPDVFPSTYGRGLRPNSLAALSELLNGAWWNPQSRAFGEAAIPPRSFEVLAGTAGLSGQLKRSGVEHNFLVGTTNVKHVAMESGDGRLFEMVGSALLAWVTDPVLQGNLKSYAFGNENQRTEPEDEDFPWNFGDAGESPLPVFNSLGFARVSLGTTYLREYSIERLGKRIVRHLTRAHLDGGAADQARQALGTSAPDRVVEFLVQQYLPSFRDVLDVAGTLDDQRRSRLTQPAAGGASNTEVGAALADLLLETLTPASLASTIEEQVADVMRALGSVEPGPAAVWIDKLRSLLGNDVMEALTKGTKADLPESISNWARAATESMPVRIEREAGRFGLLVAAELVEAFGLEVKNALIPELEQRRLDFAAWGSVSEAEHDFLTTLDVLPGDNRKIASSDPRFDAAVRKAVEVIAFNARALVAGQAVTLMERFRSGMVRPLTHSLNAAFTSLQASTSDIADWPEWLDNSIMPQHLQPPKSDMTVLDPKHFGAIFRGLLNQTHLDLREGEVEVVVTNEIASSSFARDALEGIGSDDPKYRVFAGATLLGVNQRWIPGLDIDDGDFASTPIGVEVRVGTDEMRARTQHWLMRPDYPFESFLSMNLRTYTEGEVAGLAAQSVKDRQGLVVAKLRQAIDSAAPLVELYDETIGSIHPSMKDPAKRFELLVSKVPFAGTSIEQEIKEILGEKVFKSSPDRDRDRDIAAVMIESAELPHIDIVSFLSSPVSPVTIKTLLDPIAQRWAMAKSKTRDKSDFWLHRRARPLGEFIPLPQAHLYAALRGWFTGRIVGIIRSDELPFRILAGATDTNPRWVEFPDAFLSKTSGGDADKSALVLESLALAIAYAPSSENASLEAYLELVKLGMSDPSGEGSVFRYSTLNPVLAGWIEQGRIELRSSVTPAPSDGILADSTRATPEQRLEDVQRFLASNRDSFKKERERYYAEDVKRSSEVLNDPPIWPGLWTQIDGAHQALLSAANNHRIGADGGRHGSAGTPVG